MSTYDVSPNDEPVDVAGVGADDMLVESLRRSLSPTAAVVWDDDDDELDPAFALLRALQRDVASDLPAAAALLPAGVSALVPRQRRFGRTAAIAAVTAGVLSIGGVAAAAGGTGSPLAGVRSAVSSVVNAFTPDHRGGPSAAKSRHSGQPSPKAGPTGEAVSDASRSAAAAAQIAAQLDTTGRLLDAGKYTAAKALLDSAAARLSLVLDSSARDGLATRITALRARLASPRPEPTHQDNASGDNSTGPVGQANDSTGGGADSGTSRSTGTSGDAKAGTGDKGSSGKGDKGSSGKDSSGKGSSGKGSSGKGDKGSSGKARDDSTPAPHNGGRTDASPVPHGKTSDASSSDLPGHATKRAAAPGDSGQTHR